MAGRNLNPTSCSVLLHKNPHCWRRSDIAIEDIPASSDHCGGNRIGKHAAAGPAITANHHRTGRQCREKGLGIPHSNLSRQRGAHNAPQSRDTHDQLIHGAFTSCRVRRHAG